jgi:O-antigen/teichoic acid export membrane protein
MAASSAVRGKLLAVTLGPSGVGVVSQCVGFIITLGLFCSFGLEPPIVIDAASCGGTEVSYGDRRRLMGMLWSATLLCGILGLTYPLSARWLADVFLGYKRPDESVLVVAGAIQGIRLLFSAVVYGQGGARPLVLLGVTAFGASVCSSLVFSFWSEALDYAGVILLLETIAATLPPLYMGLRLLEHSRPERRLRFAGNGAKEQTGGKTGKGGDGTWWIVPGRMLMGVVGIIFGSMSLMFFRSRLVETLGSRQLGRFHASYAVMYNLPNVAMAALGRSALAAMGRAAATSRKRESRKVLLQLSLVVIPLAVGLSVGGRIVVHVLYSRDCVPETSVFLWGAAGLLLVGAAVYASALLMVRGMNTARILANCCIGVVLMAGASSGRFQSLPLCFVLLALSGAARLLFSVLSLLVRRAAERRRARKGQEESVVLTDPV